MEIRPPRVRAAARFGLVVLAALVSPCIAWAQDVAAVASTTLVATPSDVMAAASAAIPVLKADSSMAAALVAQYTTSISELKARIDALKANIQQVRDQIDKIKAEIEKVEAELAKFEQLKEKELAKQKDAKSSLYAMRMVASDRAAASKLLDAMKQRNASTLGTLLDPGSNPASIVSVDVLSPSAIKMIFKVGVLTQCVATRPNCGTATYSIVK